MSFHPSVRTSLETLREIAPGAPLLALGQTVFWDEPLKAILPLIGQELSLDVRLVAGIHDTDYFAKLPGGLASKEPFVALRKNDGSTKNFWSAAGEFSALFGSETPVRREAFAQAGVSLDRFANVDPHFVDASTEAWGWRGIAARDSRAQITSELPLDPIFDTLQSSMQWAVSESLSLLASDEAKRRAEKIAEALHAAMCDTRESCMGQTLATFYECLLSDMHKIVTGGPVPSETTRTSQLLAFSPRTCSQPRFSIVDFFIREESREAAISAYNDAVTSSETYTLDKFGTGAIPFELVIPGLGRGTIRLTRNALVVMTPEPKFVQLASPIRSIADLADVVEKEFGPCALTGKAITLISMLAAEYVFAFHETASPYVSLTCKMNGGLRKAGFATQLNPILRIDAHAWDALDAVEGSLRLPEPLQKPFDAKEITCEEFSRRWRSVIEEQKRVLASLEDARGPQAVICALACIVGEGFRQLAQEYENLRSDLLPLAEEQSRLSSQVAKIHERLRSIKVEWAALEDQMGRAFRDDDLHQRVELANDIKALRAERRELRNTLAQVRSHKAAISSQPQVIAARTRRREIEKETELLRIEVVRNAYLTIHGLQKTNHRPAAWWLPLVSSDGSWLKRIMEVCTMRLEPLAEEGR